MLLRIILVLFSIFFLKLAEAQESQTIKLQGVVPVYIDFRLSGPTDAATGAGGPNPFDIGALEIPGAIRFEDVNVNRPMYFKIRNKGWTLPRHYNPRIGSKSLDGTDGDLQLKCVSMSSERGKMEVMGGFGSDFVAVTATPQPFLQLGDIDSHNYYHGLVNGTAVIDARILLDPLRDPPGTYEVELELMIAIDP